MTQPLEIGLLRTFVVLTEERSVTRAARRLCRSQPAISLQIRRLEEAAGCRLFDDDLRHLRLTVNGETLLPYARSLLQMHDDVKRRLLSNDVEGRVVLGCPDPYVTSVLPDVLASFRERYPRIEVTVHCSFSRQLALAMDDGIIDLAIATLMRGVAPNRGMVRHLRSEPLSWLGAEDSDAHMHEPVPLALLPEGNLHRDRALMALNEAGRRWRIAYVSDNSAGLQALALGGGAVTVLPSATATRGLRWLGAKAGMPQLAPVDLMLWRRQPGLPLFAEQLAYHIEENLSVR